MRRLILLLFLFLFVAGNILLVATPRVKSGIQVSPAKLYITIEDYPEKEIHYKIKITNPFSREITASAEVIHPYGMEENYTRIPDLSWVKLLPETLDTPAHSYNEIEVLVDIPENKKTLHCNESWETWVVVTPRLRSILGGTLLQIQLAVKLFIHTPKRTITSGTLPAPYILYPTFGFIICLIALFTTFFYIKKKRNIKADRPAIFYIKKKK
ncbi:MAG: hypothetical protein JSW60_01305 [Thermoplasmatales archaeon]|nr:MAG: hypothetical protein JSW60_01305 [Thermoplasmatales archaeon]